MRELALALAVSSRDWVDRLHRHTLDFGGARVRVRVLSAAGAADQDFDVLLIDDTCSFLDARLVTDLHAAGKAVVGVIEATQRLEATEWLDRQGVRHVVDADAPPERFIEVAGLAAGSRPAATDDCEEASVEPTQAQGRLLAVMGASGGVGATEISIAAAFTMRTPTVLVDLDTLSPSVAQRLGLRLLPNLRSALQVRRHTPGRLDDELHRVSDSVRVLPGMASPSEWSHARPADVLGLLTDLRRHGDVLVNLPAGVPAGGAVAGPHDVSRAVLGAADLVTVVSLPTPIGVSRLLEWSAAARVVGVDQPAVVLNRAPKSSFVRSEIEREVRRVLNPHSIGFVPSDDRVVRASWDGTPVGRGPFVASLTKAVGEWLAA